MTRRMSTHLTSQMEILQHTLIWKIMGLALIATLNSGCLEMGGGFKAVGPEELSSNSMGTDQTSGTIPMPDADPLIQRGVQLYSQNCVGCHFSLENSSIRDKSETDISNAIQNLAQMSFLNFLTSQDLTALRMALATTPPTSDPTPPPSTDPGSGTDSGNNPPPGGGVPDTPPSIPNTSLKCDPAKPPGVMPIRRLSKLEYRNTIKSVEIYPQLIFDDLQNKNVPPFEAIYNIIPDDSREIGLFERLDRRIAAAHVEGFYIFGFGFGSETFGTSELAYRRSTAYAEGQPSFQGTPCLKNLLNEVAMDTAACVSSFLSKFGKRAFRRPLPPDELTRFTNIYSEIEAVYGRRMGMRAVMTAVLLAPQYLFHLENQGQPQPDNPKMLRLTDHELAARLSYFSSI